MSKKCLFAKRALEQGYKDNFKIRSQIQPESRGGCLITFGNGGSAVVQYT
jgi:hypothetical protein